MKKQGDCEHAHPPRYISQLPHVSLHHISRVPSQRVRRGALFGCSRCGILIPSSPTQQHCSWLSWLWSILILVEEWERVRCETSSQGQSYACAEQLSVFKGMCKMYCKRDSEWWMEQRERCECMCVCVTEMDISLSKLFLRCELDVSVQQCHSREGHPREGHNWIHLAHYRATGQREGWYEARVCVCVVAGPGAKLSGDVFSHLPCLTSKCHISEQR